MSAAATPAFLTAASTSAAAAALVEAKRVLVCEQPNAGKAFGRHGLDSDVQALRAVVGGELVRQGRGDRVERVLRRVAPVLEQVLEVLLVDLQTDAVPESGVELAHGDLQEPAEIEVPLVEDCEVFGEPGASRALALVEGVDRLRERQP